MIQTATGCLADAVERIIAWILPAHPVSDVPS